MSPGLELVPVGFVVAGLLFAAIGVLTLRATRRFERTARRASGTVTDVRSQAVGSRGRRGLIWVPVVRFTTADGRAVEGEAAGGTNLRTHEPGQAVEVRYDPARPARFQVEGTPGGAAFNAVFVVFGAAIALIGLLAVVALRAFGA